MYRVDYPERYGVVKFSKDFKAQSIEEKPDNPKSNLAITDIYFYDCFAVKKAKTLKASKRGELEITDLNKLYLEENSLSVEVLNIGIAWLDTGTVDSPGEASSFIKTIEHRQVYKIGCPEEISWRNGLIKDKQLEIIAKKNIKSGYGEYLLLLLVDKMKFDHKQLSTTKGIKLIGPVLIKPKIFRYERDFFFESSP